MSNIDYKDITIVVQGSTLENNDITPSKNYIYKCIESIKLILPKSKIILSTWENENINSDIVVDDIVFNKDPGFKPRGDNIDSKPNNVNRQIVSSINGLKKVKTKYALKFRTDFYFINNNFIKYFDLFKNYDPKYKVVNKRILCCMFGTRKPVAKHYSLPFHVSDFSTFGLTEDLINLYDIPLATYDEFNYFKIHKDKPRSTYAVNRYNAEQTIIINFLRKNNKKIDLEFSTDVNDNIIKESDRFLVNNFYPLSFSQYGIRPMKKYLLPSEKIDVYTDFYTQYEFKELYKIYIDNNFILDRIDNERIFINKNIDKLRKYNSLLKYNKFIPKFILSLIRNKKNKINMLIDNFL